jgi:hypothetical protein
MDSDREFADRLVSMTEAEFDEWANNRSIIEILEATARIVRASLELQEEMDSCIEESLESEDYSEAMDVLSQFTLKNSGK